MSPFPSVSPPVKRGSYPSLSQDCPEGEVSSHRMAPSPVSTQLVMGWSEQPSGCTPSTMVFLAPWPLPTQPACGGTCVCGVLWGGGGGDGQRRKIPGLRPNLADRTLATGLTAPQGPGRLHCPPHLPLLPRLPFPASRWPPLRWELGGLEGFVGADSGGKAQAGAFGGF